MRKLTKRHGLKRPRQLHASGSSAADPRTLRVSRRAALVGGGWIAGRVREREREREREESVRAEVGGELDKRDNVCGSEWEAERARRECGREWMGRGERGDKLDGKNVCGADVS